MQFHFSFKIAKYFYKSVCKENPPKMSRFSILPKCKDWNGFHVFAYVIYVYCFLNLSFSPSPPSLPSQQMVLGVWSWSRFLPVRREFYPLPLLLVAGQVPGFFEVWTQSNPVILYIGNKASSLFTSTYFKMHHSNKVWKEKRNHPFL